MGREKNRLFGFNRSIGNDLYFVLIIYRHAPRILELLDFVKYVSLDHLTCFSEAVPSENR